MDLERGFAKFESFPPRSRGSEPLSNPLQADSIKHANLGKVTRYGPHDERSDCVCRHCRKARMLERRSWEPLSIRDKVYVYGALGCGAGILALFLIAAVVS